MAEESGQDKSLPASARKIERAREEGQVARSRDVGHALVLGASFAMLGVLMPWIFERLTALMRTGLRFDRAALTDAYASNLIHGQLVAGLEIWAPFGIAGALMGAAGAVAVSGFIFTGKPLIPQFNRIDPISGFGRLFSAQSLVENLKLFVVLMALVALTGYIAWVYGGQWMAVTTMPLQTALPEAGFTLLKAVFWLIGFVIFVAVLDVPLQIWRHKENLKMTVEEMRQEHKETEGNPEIKNKIRQLQRQAARQRMMAAVPTATVIVTNPTHYAVALAWDEQTGGAPKVVAKGVDAVAAKIRELGAEHKVPLLEAPPLARALYTHVEIEQEIPATLYAAVAQVLAYVFQLNASLRGDALTPSAPSSIAIPAGMDPLESPSKTV
jgi:flagellar biosynthetic protein FlhB